MSRLAEDRAIVDAGLKALAFASGPPLVCDEPAATYERASDEHGRLAVSAATHRLGLGDKIRLIPATATRPSTSMTGMSGSAATASSRSGRSPPAAPYIDARGRAEHEAGLKGRPSAVRIISTTVDQARFLVGSSVRRDAIGKINCWKWAISPLQWLAAGFELHRDGDHQSNAIGPKFVSVLCHCVPLSLNDDAELVHQGQIILDVPISPM
jgi:hypothetical protein